jgi:hypothetical protein
MGSCRLVVLLSSVYCETRLVHMHALVFPLSFSPFSGVLIWLLTHADGLWPQTFNQEHLKFCPVALLLNFHLDLGGVWVFCDPRYGSNHGRFLYVILFACLLPARVVVNYMVVTSSLLMLTRANFDFDKDVPSTIFGISLSSWYFWYFVLILLQNTDMLFFLYELPFFMLLI